MSHRSVHGDAQDGASDAGAPRPMTTPPAVGEDDVDYGHRHFINLLSVAVLLLIAVAMVWTVKALDDQESLRKCVSSGRKDCVQIAAPPKGMVQAVR